MYGELVPVGGGDPIPLLKELLRVGRRENSDIILRFPNVSSSHCVLTLEEGYWFVKDQHSANGVKVNGTRIEPESRKRLDPGDVLAIGKHQYEIKYSPYDLGAMGTPPSDDEEANIMRTSLLERAGLSRRPEQEASRRYDPRNNSPGQLRKRRDD